MVMTVGLLRSEARGTLTLMEPIDPATTLTGRSRSVESASGLIARSRRVSDPVNRLSRWQRPGGGR